jgi:tRNA-dihydrouridine synthase B
VKRPPHPGLSRLPAPIVPGLPVTALAPMQDVTDLTFMEAVADCGPPDWFFTEYFRVTETSRPERHILRSITENTTGRPVFGQLIGEDIRHLWRTVEELKTHPIAGIDLNLGCPAPKVYKKNVGGGLLRDMPQVDRIFEALREVCGEGLFTVKSRIGFEDTQNFETLLDLVEKHRVDLFSLHGRTVKELYRSDVHYEYIKRAVARLPCPVLANGNITSADKAAWVVATTGAAGVMVGRSGIRNPWIFSQIRDRFAGRTPKPVPLRDVRAYVDRLHEASARPGVPERACLGRMKKHLNFIGVSVDPGGRFLREMRRAGTLDDLFRVCDRHMLDDPDAILADEPHAGVIARPNCETPIGCG